MTLAAILETWLVSIMIAIPVFLVIETWRPRHRVPIRWRAIAIGAGLFGLNRFVVWTVNSAPASQSLPNIVTAWLLAELAAYGVHRAMHAFPVLWRFHRLHHRPETLGFHVSWWIHPVDVALFGIANTLACYLAGAPVVAAAWFLVLRRGWAVLLHANIAWPATLLDRLITTPSLHHRHHREDLPPANFAANLAILDRVFGTWRR